MKQSTLYYGEMESPVGPLSLLSTEDELVRIDFGLMRDIEVKINKWVQRYFPKATIIERPEKVEHAIEELRAYFNKGIEEFSIPYALHGTPFQKSVWKALYEHVPYGETKTYKDLAVLVDNPKAVRAIGGTMNKNPFSIVIPCHRIVGMSGKLVGYGGGVDKKIHLLQHEGITL